MYAVESGKGGSGSSALSTDAGNAESDDTEQADDSTLEINKSLSDLSGGESRTNDEGEADADDGDENEFKDPETSGAFGRFVDVVGGGSGDN